MMSRNLIIILIVVVCSTLLWTSILLLHPTQSDPGHSKTDNTNAGPLVESSRKQNNRVSRFSPPLSPVYNYYFQTPEVTSLSLIETLYYEFHPNRVDCAKNASLVISKPSHEVETLKQASTDSPLDSTIKERGDKLCAFNLLVSNRIGIFRPLPDTRPTKCPKVEQQHVVEYNSGGGLPSRSSRVSIVICYYNEVPSALLRTVTSILVRSELELIREIIIIDDFSEDGYDAEQIKPFIESDLVKVIRTTKREGLIRARSFGADMAKGDILIFLDSHVEANIGWLNPLIKTIDESPTTIACPMIDLINAETLIYSASPMVKGGLSWALHFKWDSVPASDLKTYDDFVKPIATPTMAGGLYAISRDYFYQLGAYDSGMNLWGGENIELSLRTWMCGGKIVILPCSRLGHIFRKTRPYGPEPDQPDSLLYNSHRSARVWLDEYIHKFFESSPGAESLDSGDVTDRIELRQKLGCNNFTWFLDNVYPKLKKELVETSESSSIQSEDKPKPSSTVGLERVNSEL